MAKLWETKLWKKQTGWILGYRFKNLLSSFGNYLKLISESSNIQPMSRKCVNLVLIL
jgi:hypothetical protein